jgi:hypothetical protein
MPHSHHRHVAPYHGECGKPGNHHQTTLSRQFSNTKLLFSLSSAKGPSTRHHIATSIHTIVRRKQTNKRFQTQGHSDISFSVFAGALYQSAQCCHTVQPTSHFQCDAFRESAHRDYTASILPYSQLASASGELGYAIPSLPEAVLSC